MVGAWIVVDVVDVVVAVVDGVVVVLVMGVPSSLQPPQYWQVAK